MQDYQEYKIKHVTKDDTFQFQCSRCCQCCKNVYQAVMTSTYDIFRIAKFENRRMEDIVMDYTEPVLISEQPIPIMMLKTIGKGKEATCILLDKRRCKLHDGAKPLVCRMYPLNLEPAQGLNRLIPCIVSQKKHHYIGKTHVVGDWLSENMDETDEAATIWWYKVAGEMGKILKNCSKAEQRQEWIMKRTILLLYIYYETDKDFLPQYAANLNRLLNELREQIGD